jgi:hypothetical protein
MRNSRPSSLLDRLVKAAAPKETEPDLYKAAIRGNRAAVWRLLDTTVDQTVDVLLQLCRCKAPLAVFGEALLSVHRQMPARFSIKDPESRAVLTELFSFASFDPPGDVPEIVTLWRGTSGIDIEQARQGYYWPRSFAVACRFALSASVAPDHPLVLRAEVPRASVSYFGGGLDGEDEALLLRSPEAVDIDGTPECWAEHAARHPAVASGLEVSPEEIAALLADPQRMAALQARRDSLWKECLALKGMAP